MLSLSIRAEHPPSPLHKGEFFKRWQERKEGGRTPATHFTLTTNKISTGDRSVTRLGQTIDKEKKELHSL